ncbi:ATP-binding cassette subfamily G member 4-like, partial [Oppia nitens]|uniref:ATP-binding cassette subfamily G member 4-like n=1 Tax=Oppia nitens TaxID=1686743 RepID=UPI0023DAABFD
CCFYDFQFHFLTETGWYSTGSYYLAKNIVELPMFIVTVTIYVVIVYKINPQINETNRFVGFMLVMFGCGFCSQGLGFLCGILFRSDLKMALVFNICMVLVNLLLCGFYAALRDLPDWAQSLAHISYVKQSFEMILYLVYGFDRCPSGLTSSILYQNDLLDENKFWWNGPILAVHGLTLRVLGFIIMMFKTNSFSLSWLCSGRSDGSKKSKRVDSSLSMKMMTTRVDTIQSIHGSQYM